MSSQERVDGLFIYQFQFLSSVLSLKRTQTPFVESKSVSGKSGSGSESAGWTLDSARLKSVTAVQDGGGPTHLVITSVLSHTQTGSSSPHMVQVLSVFDSRAGLHRCCLSWHLQPMIILWHFYPNTGSHTHTAEHFLHSWLNCHQWTNDFWWNQTILDLLPASASSPVLIKWAQGFQ